ncbi:MAG: biotin/lipoyl-containing protein, partial [Chloroflexota bacterium]
EPPGFDPGAITPHGHAIEARIYAEDPARDFLPATGTIVRWRPPAGEGVRVDDGVRTGDTVSINYDPMIAKVIAWGETRAEAVRRLDYALAQTQLMGLRNNIAFLRRVLMHPAHLAGDISTHFLDAHPELATTDVDTPPAVLIACAIAMAGESQPGLAAWRNNRFRPIRHTLAPVDAASTEPVDVLLTPRSQDVCEAEVAGGTHTVHMSARAVDALTLVIDGHRQHFTLANDGDRWWVHTDGHTHTLDWQTPLPLPGQTAAAAGSLRAPMPGQVIRVEVSAGQHVQQGALLLVLEAMKMEHRIEAPYDGVVGSVHYGVGDTVQADAALLEIEPEAAGEAAATD